MQHLAVPAITLALALVGVGICRGQTIHVDDVDRTVVPVGETMVFTGTGLTNASSVVLHWLDKEHPAIFSVASSNSLNVTMPTVTQDVRAHYVTVRSPQDTTVVLPHGVEYNGTETLPSALPGGGSIAIIKAGAIVTCNEPMPGLILYVETGGVLVCSGRLMSTAIFAEDGAAIDLAGVTEATGVVLYTSPLTSVVGSLPSGFPNGSRVAPLTSITRSSGIGYFYIGRSLTVNITGSGSVAASPDREYYTYNTLVTLTASAASNSVFSAWSGDVTATDPSIQFRIKESMTLTATFVAGWILQRYTGPGGSVVVSPDQPCYAGGTVVSLTAQPATGYVFDAWGGDPDGTNSSVTVTMDQHRRFLAAFRKLDESDRPLIESIDPTAVPLGDTMTFSGEALTNATAVSLHWARYDFAAPYSSNSNGTLTVTMPSVRQDVRAHYASVRTPAGTTYTVSAGAYEFTDRGTLPMSVVADTVVVCPGARLRLEENLMLLRVHVMAGGILEFYGSTFTIPQVQAEDGALLDFTLSTEIADGQLCISPGTIMVGEIPAGPLVGHGVSVSVIPPISLSPGVGDLYIGRELSLNIEGPGSVDASPNMRYYPYNTLVTLTAVPGPYAAFLAWSGSVNSSAKTISFRIKNDMSLTATFVGGFGLERHTGPGGTVSVSPDLPFYDDGDVVSLTAQPESGFQFSAWGGDVTGSTASVSLTMDSHKRVLAVFEPIDVSGRPQIDSIAPMVVNVGEAMTFSGNALSNATSVYVHWAVFNHSAPFTINSNGTLTVTMPPLRQEIRPHYASVQTPDGTTYTMPDGVYEFTGRGTIPMGVSSGAILVCPGATLRLDELAWMDRIHVMAGGILEFEGVSHSPLVYAEDGALLDFTESVAINDGRFVVSPETIMVGDIPPSDFGSGSTVTQLTSISLSRNIPYLRTGFEFTVATNGPGSVSLTPEKSMYTFGENVTLSANPDTGCYFIRWLGDAEGTSSQTVVRVRGATAVTARFSANPDYFQSWRPQFFTTEELGNMAISGMAADPDGDGYSNAAEYLFASNPRVGGDVRRIKMFSRRVDEEVVRVVQYVRPAEAGDAKYTVMVSSDMVDWHHNGDGSSVVYSREIDCVNIGDGLERVEAAVYPDGNSPASTFVRIHATLFE